MCSRASFFGPDCAPVIKDARLEVAETIKSLFVLTDAMGLFLSKMPGSEQAATIQLRDGNDEDVQEVRASLDCYVLQSFPDASLAIRNRLVDTILLRYKRILCLQLRYGQDTNWTLLTPAQPNNPPRAQPHAQIQNLSVPPVTSNRYEDLSLFLTPSSDRTHHSEAQTAENAPGGPGSRRPCQDIVQARQ